MRESLFDPETGKLRDRDALKSVGVSVLGDTYTYTDERNATITRHADGSQGVTVRPKMHMIRRLDLPPSGGSEDH